MMMSKPMNAQGLKRRATVANLTEAVHKVHALHDDDKVLGKQKSPVGGLTWDDCLEAWDDVLVRHSPMMSSKYKKSPPPGFENTETLNSSGLRSSLKLTNEINKRRKSIQFADEVNLPLKRCVTFAGSMVNKSDSEIERGGKAHMRLRSECGVRASPPHSPPKTEFSFSDAIDIALKRSASEASLCGNSGDEDSNYGSSPKGTPNSPGYYYNASTAPTAHALPYVPPPPPAVPSNGGDVNPMQYLAQQQATFSAMMANQVNMLNGAGVGNMAQQFYQQQMVFYQQMQAMQFAMLAANQQNFQQNFASQQPNPSLNQRKPQMGQRNVYTPRKNASSLSPQAHYLLSQHKNIGYNITISEMKKYANEFAVDGQGSRVLQHRVEIANDEDREILLREMLKEAIPLMQNVFANYVWQAMLDHATPKQRNIVLGHIRGSIGELAHHSHGCRVVQRLLEVLDCSGRNTVIRELLDEESVQQLSKDLNTCHVMQKAVVLLQSDDFSESRATLQRIENDVAPFVVELSVHPNAYLFICKLIGERRGEKCSALLKGISTSNFLMLAMDQSGTFVLQHALTKSGNTQFVKRLLKFVRHHIVELSMHRFASHLAEVSLKEAGVHSKQDAELLCRELIQPQGRNLERMGHSAGADRGAGLTDPVLYLMRDTFANFVYQRAFDISQGKLREMILSKVKDGYDFLSKYKHGRHLVKHVLRHDRR